MNSNQFFSNFAKIFKLQVCKLFLYKCHKLFMTFNKLILKDLHKQNGQ